MKKDLRDILNEWEYDEDDNVRFITGDDGRDIMQIRQPLGIEQYNLDGRPDGFRPDGGQDFLDVYLKNEAAAGGKGLVLDDDAFQKLQSEGVLFYQRYLALFQVGHYDRVARDTNHNLSICALLERRYPGTGRYEILQYQPYIRRINAISLAMIRLSEENSEAALEELKKGRGDIESLPPVPTPIFEFEKIRSLQHLAQVQKQVQEDIVENGQGSADNLLGFKERLSEELKSAVENEDYERAARLRDRLNGLD